jgi:hypothetical protein
VSLGELGYHVSMADGAIGVAERLEKLNRRIVELVAEFPDVATLYDDVDRLDRWLERRTVRGGSDAPIWTYLSWVEGIVDGVVRRIVDSTFGPDDSELLSPDRAAAFLERFDAVLQQVLDRWMREVDLQAEMRGGRRDASSREGSRGNEEGAS